MKILIADDDGVGRMVLEHRLKADGYEVVSVGDGLRARELLEADPDLRIALLDWEMPGLDGIDLCRWVRTTNREPYVYVMLVSAKDLPEDIVRGLDAGADDYVPKPVNPVELMLRLRAAGRMLSLQDELARARDALRFQAMHDPLTGLPNRNGLSQRLEQELARVGRGGAPLAVVVVDLDHFKSINDRFGHPTGDAVLRAAAARLREGVRSYDLVARFGGEEFVLVLPDCGTDGACRVAARTRDVLRSESIRVAQGELVVTASFGVATTAQYGSASASLLLGAADAALYRAKANGRDRVEVANDSDFHAATSAASVHPRADSH